MTQPFFCADASHQTGERLLGSVTPYQTYVLVECPFPWTSDAFASKEIPLNLRHLVQSVRQAGLPVRFLLVNSGKSSQASKPSQSGKSSQIRPPDRSHLLVYQRSSATFCQGFQRWEGTVEHLEEIAPLVQAHLMEQSPLEKSDDRAVRDLLICVHGSHDKCCAKYGYPFYREAIETIAHLNHHLNHLESRSIRLWQTSHFGGHRFAPTMIDFPTGRYYGRLNQSVLRSILTRSGDLQDLQAVYRGWSVLPTWLQVVEWELIQQYGWSWFDYQIAYQRLSHNDPSDSLQAQIAVRRSSRSVHFYFFHYGYPQQVSQQILAFWQVN